MCLLQASKRPSSKELVAISKTSSSVRLLSGTTNISLRYLDSTNAVAKMEVLN